MSEEEKIIQEQQKIIDDMKDGLRNIGDFSDALKAVLVPIIDGKQEAPIIRLTLTKIAELVDQNI